jgi:hypothetical protein
MPTNQTLSSDIAEYGGLPKPFELVVVSCNEGYMHFYSTPTLGPTQLAHSSGQASILVGGSLLYAPKRTDEAIAVHLHPTISPRA